MFADVCALRKHAKKKRHQIRVLYRSRGEIDLEHVSECCGEWEVLDSNIVLNQSLGSDVSRSLETTLSESLETIQSRSIGSDVRPSFILRQWLIMVLQILPPGSLRRL